jgi:hypothetical protein
MRSETAPLILESNYGIKLTHIISTGAGSFRSCRFKLHRVAGFPFFGVTSPRERGAPAPPYEAAGSEPYE